MSSKHKRAAKLASLTLDQRADRLRRVALDNGLPADSFAPVKSDKPPTIGYFEISIPINAAGYKALEREALFHNQTVEELLAQLISGAVTAGDRHEGG